MSDDATIPRIEPVPLFSDRPDDGATHFHFDALVRSMVGMLARRDNPTPFVFLVDGPWGSGKTSLMKSVIARLATFDRGEDLRLVKTVFFDAWKYKNEDEIFPALVQALFAEMQSEGWLAEFKGLMEFAGNTDWQKVISGLAQSLPVGGEGVAAFVEGPDWLRDVALYDKAKPYLEGLITAWCSAPKERLGELKVDLKKIFTANITDLKSVTSNLKQVRKDRNNGFEDGIVAVFVDDLDRCPKEHVYEVLKALNLLVDLECCAFVLGADEDRVARAMADAHHATKEDGREGERYGHSFLSKIVQLHLVLPTAGDVEMGRYLDTLLDGQGRGGSSFLELIGRNQPLLCLGLPRNPREIKRYLNVAVMRLGLLDDLARLDTSDEASEPTDDERKALLVYLMVTGELPPALARDAEFVLGLQKYAADDWRAAGETLEEGGDARALVGGRPRVDRKALALRGGQASERTAVHLDLVSDEALERVVDVLGAVAGTPSELSRGLLDRFASFGGVYEREGGIAELDEAQVDRTLEQESERRQRVAGDATPIADRLLRGMRPNVEAPARVDALLEMLRTGPPWDRGSSPEVGKALANRQGDEQAGLLCEAAHGVLLRAFEETRLAENVNLMAWALQIRDATVAGGETQETGAFEDPVWRQFAEADIDPDPFMVRFWGQELKLIARAGRGTHQDPAHVQGRLDKQEKGRTDGRSWRHEVVAKAEAKGQPSPALTLFTLGEGEAPGEQWWLVPDGPFIAGGLGAEDEWPVRVHRGSGHRALLVAEDPVTVGQFGKFIDAGGYNLSKPWWEPIREAAKAVVGERPKPRGWEEQQKLQRNVGAERPCPVVGVTWFEAAAFCWWLNTRTGLQDWVDHPWKGRYHLPTEGQWERSARGVLGREWPIGARWHERLIVSGREDEPASLATVKENPNRSPYGARGMAGNVWEWTGSERSSKAFGPSHTGASSTPKVRHNTRMVLRGGSFVVHSRVARCAFRNGDDAGVWYLSLGFRCVRDVG